MRQASTGASGGQKPSTRNTFSSYWLTLWHFLLLKPVEHFWDLNHCFSRQHVAPHAHALIQVCRSPFTICWNTWPSRTGFDIPAVNYPPVPLSGDQTLKGCTQACRDHAQSWASAWVVLRRGFSHLQEMWRGGWWKHHHKDNRTLLCCKINSCPSILCRSTMAQGAVKDRHNHVYLQTYWHYIE